MDPLSLLCRSCRATLCGLCLAGAASGFCGTATSLCLKPVLSLQQALGGFETVAISSLKFFFKEGQPSSCRGHAASASLS